MTRIITVGHTPDMDDAFMFYALAEGHVAIGGVRIEHVIQDIQTLNQRALKAELDVTAISAASYPLIAKDYWILSVGSSIGQGYGPLVVSLKPHGPEDLNGQRIAVPGLHTTAYFLLKLAVPDFQPVTMSFERIGEAVLRGNVDAGLLIHERQLTYRDQGLLPVLDLGVWWKSQTHLPLPLGLNVVKRSLGKPLAAQIAKGLRESILYAMSHEDQVVSASMKYGRGIDASRARQFVSMYVNEETLNLSADSRKALRLFYHRALELELISSLPRSLVVIQPPKS
ncbi:MAG: ABC transporter substrate-binding protein [Candidatus Omnitrophica bacterium]|nr:ABC transporter substrate-binding protein [Candidatus Omnitrophota bacterium]